MVDHTGDPGFDPKHWKNKEKKVEREDKGGRRGERKGRKGGGRERRRKGEILARALDVGGQHLLIWSTFLKHSYPK